MSELFPTSPSEVLLAGAKGWHWLAEGIEAGVESAKKQNPLAEATAKDWWAPPCYIGAFYANFASMSCEKLAKNFAGDPAPRHTPV